MSLFTGSTFHKSRTQTQCRQTLSSFRTKIAFLPVSNNVLHFCPRPYRTAFTVCISTNVRFTATEMFSQETGASPPQPRWWVLPRFAFNPPCPARQAFSNVHLRNRHCPSLRVKAAFTFLGICYSGIPLSYQFSSSLSQAHLPGLHPCSLYFESGPVGGQHWQRTGGRKKWCKGS